MAAQNACSQPVGSCLANQLADLVAADTARATAGTTPLYFVSRWGGGQPGANQVDVCPPACISGMPQACKDQDL